MSEKFPNHHPGVAAVLSFIFNGLGQLYNGEIKKGLAIMTATSVCLIVILFGGILSVCSFLAKPICLFGIVSGLIIFAVGIIGACCVGYYSITDAYSQAEKK